MLLYSNWHLKKKFLFYLTHIDQLIIKICKLIIILFVYTIDFVDKILVHVIILNNIIY